MTSLPGRLSTRQLINITGKTNTGVVVSLDLLGGLDPSLFYASASTKINVRNIGPFV